MWNDCPITNDCPIFYVTPSDLIRNADIDPPTDEDASCNTDCCNCGYIQYESLIPYLKEIRSSIKDDAEDGAEFEFKLRTQILEISRLFDISAGVKPGYFSKAHYSTTKVLPTNGTRFIKLPTFVPNTLEVRTMGNVRIDPSAYEFRDNFLVYHPCREHRQVGCTMGCRNSRYRRPIRWPYECYKITARWGSECADPAVGMAIRDYLIESYRTKDPVVLAATGLPISRTFTVPHSWALYINNFKAKRDLYSKFAFA